MKYTKIFVVTLISGCIMSGFITIMAVIGGIFGNNLFDEFTGGKLTAEMEMLLFYLTVSFICFIIFNFMYLPMYIAKAFLFAKDSVNKRYVDTKQSIYTRDLPEFNSAIAGEILDFKTSFQEEYIAGVIELISKGYIIENEERIFVDKTKSTEKLLKNEKYILQTCENVNYNSFLTNNYNFYQKIKEDMSDLGLYKRNIFFKGLINKVMYYINKYNKRALIILYCIPFILCLLLISFLQNFLMNLIFLIALYFIILVWIRKSKLTPKGELEKENMGKLKLFLEKETNFKDKSETERELWGRYSAFAVAFGLNTEMREEITNKILKKK